MPDSALLFELVLRGAAIGALAATAIAFIRSRASLSLRVAGLLFCLCIIAYVLNSSPFLRASLAFAGIPVDILSWGGGGYFWLFVLMLFEDRRISPWMLAPAGVLTVVGFAGATLAAPNNQLIWVVHNLIEIVLAAHALFVIYRSWRGDLVEARRGLRGPFMAVVTLYIIALSGIEIGETAGIRPDWYDLAGAVALATLCLTGSFIFLQTRDALVGAAAPAAAPEAAPRIDPADRFAFEKLTEVMDKGQAWKGEGLTIGTLAEKVGLPEHRLRRLINDHSGHRNFAAFVNTRRIEAAKQTLADPGQARTTVAAIAFDLGFGSLGPFNRAFKQETGKTPTQWRRDALEKASPKPEIPG